MRIRVDVAAWILSALAAVGVIAAIVMGGCNATGRAVPAPAAPFDAGFYDASKMEKVGPNVVVLPFTEKDFDNVYIHSVITNVINNDGRNVLSLTWVPIQGSISNHGVQYPFAQSWVVAYNPPKGLGGVVCEATNTRHSAGQLLRHVAAAAEGARYAV